MPAKPIPAPRPRAASTGLGLAVLLAFFLLGAADAGAAPPAYKGVSNDGEVVFFESEEQLVPGDTDNKRDLYERSFDESVGDDGAYVTREVSIGPTGGNDAYNALFEQASADGKTVFFSTAESLVAADTDRRTDSYARGLDTGVTELVSRGASACLPGCGNDVLLDAGFAGATADGDEVFVVTVERLDPAADTDGSVDVYERDLATDETNLVSAGGSSCAPACGNGEFVATLRGASADGSVAFFATSESLAAADGDGAIDIYARELPGGPTTLVSAGDPACAPCGNSAAAAIFAGSSTSGDRVFFATSEGLVPADVDGANDVYQRSGGVTTLVSAGTASQPASFAAAPGSGSRAFFVTAESLVGADTNDATDIYMWEGGAPQLISSGSCCDSTFAAVTSDAATVFFTTTESLAVGDGDGSADIYAQDVAGGAPVFVSAGDPACDPCGDGAAAARFNRASADGSRVFFTSVEVLSPQDFDADDDIYARDVGAGVTSLSTPPPGLCPMSGCDATFVDASSDGAHVLFQTVERLVAEDVDSEADIYERGDDAGLGGEVTRLISTGNSSALELGPAPPDLKGTLPGSPGASTQPTIVGSAQGGSSIKIYSTSSCSGEPVATGTAADLAGPGIGVTVGAGSTTSFWATAEAEGFTSLCSNPVSYTQQSPAPPPSDGSGSGSDSGSGPGLGSSSAPQATPVTDPVKTRNGIAYVAPLTRITFGPSAKTRYPRPVFRFADSTGQPGTRFSCKLDRGRWKPCGSPIKLPRLRRGRHVFSVKAFNAVGDPGPRPVSRAFKLVPR